MAASPSNHEREIWKKLCERVIHELQSLKFEITLDQSIKNDTFSERLKAMKNLNILLDNYMAHKTNVNLAKIFLAATMYHTTEHMKVIFDYDSIVNLHNVTMLLVDELRTSADNNSMHVNLLKRFLLNFVKKIELYKKRVPSDQSWLCYKDTLFLSLWHVSLFGCRSATKAVSYAMLGHSYNADIDTVISRITLHCAGMFSKCDKLEKLPKISEFYLSLFKTFYKERNCTSSVLKNFVVDIPDLLKSVKTMPSLEGTFGIKSAYARLSCNNMKRAIKEKNWTWNESWEENICYRILPVLIEEGFTNTTFMIEKISQCQEGSEYRDALENMYQQLTQKKILSGKKNMKDVHEQKIKNWIQKSLKEPHNNKALVDEWLKGDGYQVDNTLTYLHRQSIFLELYSVLKSKTKVPTFECADNFIKTAFSMAAFLLTKVIIYQKAGEAFEVCIVTTAEISEDQLEYCRNTYNEIAFYNVTEQIEPGQQKRVRYGSVKDMEDQLKKLQVDKKQKLRRFGILVDSTSTPCSDKEITLTPLLLYVYFEASIYRQAYPLDQVSEEQAKKDLAKVITKKLKTEENIILDMSLVERQIDVALSIIQKNNDYSLDQQLKSEREHLCSMQSMFTKSWIRLKEAVAPGSHSFDTTKAIFTTSHTEKQLSSLFIEKKNKWMDVIKTEVEMAIKNKKAVLVVTTRPQTQDIAANVLSRLSCKHVLVDPKNELKSTDVAHVDVTDRSTFTNIRSACDLHIVSCSFPRSYTDSGRLSGHSICFDNYYTQRFILCTEHMPRDIAQYLPFSNKIIAKESNWIPLSFNLNESATVNAIDIYLKHLKYNEGNCWDIYESVNVWMKELEGKLGSTYDDVNSNFHMWLKVDKQWKKHFADIFSHIRKVGSTDSGSLDFAKLQTGTSYRCAMKHFANVQTMENIVENALLAQKYRPFDHKPNVREGETILHYPGDPDAVNAEQTVVHFNNRTAFHVNFTKKNDVDRISIVRGSFEMSRTYPDRPLDHFEVGNCSFHEEAAIYRRWDNDTNVIQYMDNLLNDAKKLGPILEHHKQVQHSCSPGEIYTVPASKIYLTAPSQFTFGINIKNKSTEQLFIRFSESSKGTVFRLSHSTIAINLLALGPDDSAMINGEYLKTAFKEDESHHVQIDWMKAESGTDIVPAFDSNHYCSKTITIQLCS